LLPERARSECAGYPLLLSMQRVMTAAVGTTPSASQGEEDLAR